MFKSVSCGMGPDRHDHDGLQANGQWAEAPSHAQKVSGGLAVCSAGIGREIISFSSNHPRRLASASRLLITGLRSQPGDAADLDPNHPAWLPFWPRPPLGSRRLIEAHRC